MTPTAIPLGLAPGLATITSFEQLLDHSCTLESTRLDGIAQLGTGCIHEALGIFRNCVIEGAVNEAGLTHGGREAAWHCASAWVASLDGQQREAATAWGFSIANNPLVACSLKVARDRVLS